LKTCLAPFSAALLLTASALFLTGCASGPSNFGEMDLDHDGRISRGEFTDAVAEISFAAADRNHDGFIDLAEWRAAESGGNDALFRARDLSRNGRISPQESRLAAEKNGSLAALFSAIDTNRDGFIDRDEARHYRSKLR
jgi:Ca2+-binding EF-hand superfamily protein